MRVSKALFRKALLEGIEEPYEEPTTGWAAKEPSKLEQLPDLIAAAELFERERIILAHRLEGLTLKEIAQKYNISTERVRRILSRAVWKLSMKRKEAQMTLKQTK